MIVFVASDMARRIQAKVEREFEKKRKSEAFFIPYIWQ